MESVAVVMGFLMRLGIPLALTALLVWWLQKLDARWQMDAEQARRQAESGPSLTPPAPRCWDVRGCSPERRANCPAFARTDVPCWQVFRDGRGPLKEACLECLVFKKAPVPAPTQLPVAIRR